MAHGLLTNKRRTSEKLRKTFDGKDNIQRFSEMFLDYPGPKELYIVQGWKHWILALDVRKNGLGRQGERKNL